MFTCCATIHKLAYEVNFTLRTTVNKSISNTKRLNQVKKHACFQSVCEPTNKHFTSGNHISHSALVSTTTTSSSQTVSPLQTTFSLLCGMYFLCYKRFNVATLRFGSLTFPSLPCTKLVTLLLKTTTKS